MGWFIEASKKKRLGKPTDEVGLGKFNQDLGR
jgi:hypothetical protein